MDPRTRGRVILSAVDGFEISLKSFDLGCFGNISNCQNAGYNVFPGAGGYQTGAVSTNYPGHQTVSFNSGYSNLAVIEFGAGENVGIDNVRWDVRSIAAVPEPATWAMMIVGFGLVGGVMRRRSTGAYVTA